jgi:hypothetical protein
MSAVFAGVFAFPLSPSTVDHLPFKAVLHGVDGGNTKNRRFAGGLAFERAL